MGVINNKHSEAIQKTFTRKLYRGYYNMLKEGCEHTEMFIISLVFQALHNVYQVVCGFHLFDLVVLIN